MCLHKWGIRPRVGNTRKVEGEQGVWTGTVPIPKGGLRTECRKFNDSDVCANAIFSTFLCLKTVHINEMS